MSITTKRSLILTSFAVFGFFALTGSNCNPGGPYNPGGGQLDEAQTVCCSTQPPAGFIKVNDDWDPTKCGSPSSITYNVCSFQRYDNKPVGSVLQVCSSAPNPPGWSTANTSWDPTKCGHPSSTTNNIKTIQKTS